MSRRTPIALALAALLLAAPAGARAAGTGTGGMAYGTPKPGSAKKAQAPTGGATPVTPATLGPDGLAIAPAGAPDVVVAVIAAANEIATTPYRYGGGHARFDDTGYDCSGSVSYALHGAGLLGGALDSTGLARFGKRGAGTWITIYGNKTHAYMVVAGLRFDTSGRAKGGTRWQVATRSARGFAARHPAGL